MRAAHGSKILWHAKFTPQRVLQQLPLATVFMGVPTLYVRLLAEAALDRHATRNVRLFISGSAPLLLDSFKQWKSRTDHTILERYGMSETPCSPRIPAPPMRATPCKASDRRYGWLSAACVSLRVQDEHGRALAAGEIGAIQVKGPNVFAGYWRMPEQTKQEFTPDGYFKTGDVGSVDRDGYVSIAGRSKD